MSSSSLRTIYAVSELADTLRTLVEDAMPRVWVEGEISNLSRPASGHWYFTLKDERAQIRCAMFRNANRLVRPAPQNGDRVLVRAQVGFYVARGDLQLICEHLEPAGEGALLREFEALKRRLTAEGLFEADRKRPLPRLPRCIGLITSATGAAVQDVLTAIRRRFPLVTVCLWPVPVQGDAAAPAIVEALSQLPACSGADLVLLVRGGGSLEDLWAFNEEAVARAIVSCTVPVVTGVGHETDTTISDFAADLRAATPTAAAELVTPDGREFRRNAGQAHALLRRTMSARLSAARAALQALERRLQLQHPRRAIQERAQRLDDLALRFGQVQARQLQSRQVALTSLSRRLSAQASGATLRRRHDLLDALQRRLGSASATRLAQARRRLDHHAGVLAALNPRSVLQRGYAIARAPSGEVLRRPEDVATDTDFELILAEGQMRARRRP